MFLLLCLSIFVLKNTTAMKDILHYYSLFERLLEEGLVLADPSADFSSICAMIGAPEEKLDSFIFEELGMDGDAVIARYRALSKKNYYLCPIRPSAGK